MAPNEVLLWDPHPLALPDIFIVAQMLLPSGGGITRSSGLHRDRSAGGAEKRSVAACPSASADDLLE